MHFIRRLTPLALLAALILVPVPKVAAADTITVTRADGAVAADGDCSLVEAIMAANTNTTVNECVHDSSGGTDTIELSNDVTLTTGVLNTYVDGGLSGTPFITQDLIIDGMGYYVERDSNLGCPEGNIDEDFRIFSVTGSASLTLTNLLVQGGCVSSDNTSGVEAYGGAIHFESTGTLTLDTASVIDSQALGYDGGLFEAPGNAAGGGIYVDGAAAVNLIDVIIGSNYAVGGAGDPDPGGDAEGGGLYVTAGSTVVTISRTEFSRNDANGGFSDTDDGGAARGGGVYLGAGTVTTITDSVFGLQTINGGGTDERTGGNAEGGGIYNAGTITAITNTGFVALVAEAGDAGVDGGGAYGGAIYNSGTISLIDGQTLFAGNSALGGDSSGPGDGGPALGGAIYSTGTITRIEDTIFTSNSATGGSSSAIGAQGGVAIGGAVMIAAGSAGEIVDSTFSGNGAAGGDGHTAGAAAGGALGFGLSTSLTLLDNSLFDGNIATGGIAGLIGTTTRGGAVAAAASTTIGSILNSEFTGNSAVGSFVDSSDGADARGGALDIPGTITLFANNLVDNNQAVGGGSTGDEGGGAFGGGLSLLGTITTLTQSTFSNNLAEGGFAPDDGYAFGGGISVSSGAISTMSNVTVSGNRVIGTTPTGAGISSESGTLNLVHVTIWNNSGALSGGAMYMGGSSVTLNNSIAGDAAVSSCVNVGGSFTGAGNLGPDTTCNSSATISGVLGLADNGCTTPVAGGGCVTTHALLYDTSTALDAVACSLTNDERGADYPRPVDLASVDNGGTCDVGAFELFQSNEIIVEKTYNPVAIPNDGATASVLTFTITNPTDAVILDIEFEDVLDPALIPVFDSSTCVNAGGTLPPLPGVNGSAVSFAGIDLDAGDSCIVNYLVTSATAGTYPNDQDDLNYLRGKLGLIIDLNPPTTDLVTPDFVATLVVVGPGTEFVKLIDGSLSASAAVGESVNVTLIFQVDGSQNTSAWLTDPLPAFLAPADILNLNLTAIPPGTSCNSVVFGGVTGNTVESGILVGNIANQLCVMSFDVTCVDVGQGPNEAELDWNGGLYYASADMTCGTPPLPGGGGGGRGTGGNLTVSDPALSKTGLPENATVGEAVVWTIVVTNTGTEQQDNVVITDDVPDQFDIVSAKATQGTVDVNGQFITANLGTLLGGGTATITINTVANDSALPGSICNTAYWDTTPAADCVTFFPDALPPTGGPSPLMATLRTLVPLIALLGLAGVGAAAFMRRRSLH